MTDTSLASPTFLSANDAEPENERSSAPTLLAAVNSTEASVVPS